MAINLAIRNKIMTKKKTTKKVVEKKKDIFLSLTIGDLKFFAEADTFKEALEKIYKDSFGKVKT